MYKNLGLRLLERKYYSTYAIVAIFYIKTYLSVQTILIVIM